MCLIREKNQKLLSLLGALGLVATSSASVVACGNDPKENNNSDNNDGDDTVLTPINIGEIAAPENGVVDMNESYMLGESVSEFITELKTYSDNNDVYISAFMNSIVKSAINNGWTEKFTKGHYNKAWERYLLIEGTSYIKEMRDVIKSDGENGTSFIDKYLSEDESNPSTFTLDISKDADMILNDHDEADSTTLNKKVSDFFTGSVTITYTIAYK